MKKEDKVAVVKKLEDVSIIIDDAKEIIFDLWKKYPELNKSKDFMVEFSSINEQGLEPAKHWVFALLRKLRKR